MTSSLSPSAWLDAFTLALIKKEFQSIEKLIETLPAFEDEKSMQHALALIQEALELFKQHKLELRREMQKIRLNQKYIKATP